MKDTYKPVPRPDRINEWALGAIKTSVNPENIPKIQQYKEFYFPSVSDAEKTNYLKTSSKTDSFSFKIPDLNLVKQKELSFRNLKSNYRNK